MLPFKSYLGAVNLEDNRMDLSCDNSILKLRSPFSPPRECFVHRNESIIITFKQMQLRSDEGHIRSVRGTCSMIYIFKSLQMSRMVEQNFLHNGWHDRHESPEEIFELQRSEIEIPFDFEEDCWLLFSVLEHITVMCIDQLEEAVLGNICSALDDLFVQALFCIITQSISLLDVLGLHKLGEGSKLRTFFGSSPCIFLESELWTSVFNHFTSILINPTIQLIGNVSLVNLVSRP